MSAYSIASVERDTGLGKDTLRVWERRYGFPLPVRDARGERLYSDEQVERLRLIKRLLDGGARPGKVVVLDLASLRALAEQPLAAPRRRARRRSGQDEPQATSAATRADLDEALALLRLHEARGLRQLLQARLARQGLAAFVADVVAPLNRAVGEAWMSGALQVHEEHLYTEVVSAVLTGALAQVPDTPERPRVLLTTFVGEPHGLGLLMAHCLCALEGCTCISLGTQTPVADIARAAVASRSDIVALSFSPIVAAAAVRDGLGELRRLLPAAVSIWAGGSSVALDRRPVDGVRRMASLADVAPAIAAWRAAHAPANASGLDSGS